MTSFPSNVPPRHERTATTRELLKRLNGHRDPHDYGDGWRLRCEELGLDPLEATADDVLSTCPRGLWDANGKRVHQPSDAADLFVMLDQTLDAVEARIDDEQTIAWLRYVAETSNLTAVEAQVVEAVADVGTAYGYAKIIAERLAMSESSVRKRWSTARRKLRNAMLDAL